MMQTHPRSTAKIAGHPLHPMIIPFPIVLFVGALVADIVFLATGRTGWAGGAYVMLAAGLIAALLAAVLGLIDFFGDRAVRDIRAARLHLGANVIAVVLEAINLYIRYDQGTETAVAPTGVILSAAAVLLLVFSGWLGGEMVYKHHVGMSDEEASPR